MDLSELYKKVPNASLNNLIVSFEVSRDDYAQPTARGDSIGSHMEAAISLFKSCVKNGNIAKAKSEIEKLKQMHNESRVQLQMQAAFRQSNVNKHIPMKGWWRCWSSDYRPPYVAGCECSGGGSRGPIRQGSLSTQAPFSKNITAKPTSPEIFIEKLS